MAKRTKHNDVSQDEINKYSGSVELNVETIESSKTKASKFFQSYVNNRAPVVLNGHIKDKEWKGAKWTNDYIRDRCGSAVVRVEHRRDSADHFGKGQEQSMTINDFLDLLESKNENVYMTTQELSYSAEGQPSIISPPLTLLRQDFPLTPQLLNTLIISNINIWFGASTEPTTSGLHHDFHDNLYILLRGEKHFTLYSPAEAKNMYTVGEIVKVHPNGRINYKGQPTRADGADEGIEAALKAAERMRKATEKLEAAEKEVEKSGFDASLMNEAEDDVDEALEALLDAEMAANCEEEDEDDDEGDDDFNSDNSGSDFNEEEGEGYFEDFSDEEDEEQEESDKNVSRKVNIKEVAKFLGLGKRKQPDTDPSSAAEVATSSATSSTPSNFSRVDTSRSDADLQADFPLYVEAKSRAIHITLKAGQMLYLPAGWFHEVHSQGSAESGGHLAFNYWFHPPDNHDYAKPYTSDFWARDFEERLKSGNV